MSSLEAYAGKVLIVRSQPLRVTTGGRLLFCHVMQMRLMRIDLDHACTAGLTARSNLTMELIAFNRKDEMQARFIRQACKRKGVSLHQRFVPSVEGQMRVVLTGWGVSVVLALLEVGLVNLAPATHLPMAVYWPLLEFGVGGVLRALTDALTRSACRALA